MIVAMSTPRSRRSARALARAPRTRVRAWTGRAAMSLGTDSAISTFVLAGTRKSRVSEMRLLARAGAAPSSMERTGPVCTAFARRSRRASVSLRAT